MPLSRIDIAPGVTKEISELSAGARWTDASRIRFYKGQPTPIGNWQEQTTVNDIVGTPRTLHYWNALDGRQLLAVGTSQRIYLFVGGVYYNITPLADSDILGTDPFETTNGSNVVTVTHTAHTRLAGDWVIFDGATSVNGLDLDGEWRVDTVIDTNTYTILHTDNATGSGSGGGSSVDYEYEISAGFEDTTALFGWGVGPWGVGTWGTPSETGGLDRRARVWSMVNWGQDLLFCPAGREIYHWAYDPNFATRAEILPSASEAPTLSNFITLFTSARHVIAFGATPVSSSTQDPMLIRWSTQEDFSGTDAWLPQITNTAGDIRLGTGSRIIGARESMNNEILVWTDTATYSLFYTADEFVFGVRTLSNTAGLLSPHAQIEVDGRVWFMSETDFYLYDGRLQKLPCEVREHIFDDLNLRQAVKVICGTNRHFNEIWWFYPSANSVEIDRYVIYNYQENHWSIGELSRTAYLDEPRLNEDGPIMFDRDGLLFFHDLPDTAAPDYHLEQGYFMSDEGGNTFMFVDRILPDFQKFGPTSGNVNFFIRARNYPTGEEIIKGPYPISSTTEKLDVRARGREISFRFEGSQVPWQLSSIRANILPAGRR